MKEKLLLIKIKNLIDEAEYALSKGEEEVSRNRLKLMGDWLTEY